MKKLSSGTGRESHGRPRTHEGVACGTVPSLRTQIRFEVGGHVVGALIGLVVAVVTGGSKKT